MIVEVLELSLTDGGYDVVIVQSGSEALRRIETDADRFGGIVTDIRLGAGPSGWDIARRAREIVPNIPVLYMSGDSAHEWSSKGVPGSVFLPKPFGPAQLVTAVSQLITEAAMQAPRAPNDSGEV